MCQSCEFVLNKQIHQIDKKVLGQDHDFSTKVPYANKKIRDIYYFIVNISYNSTQNMNNKLQSLKGKTKLKFYQNISNYCEMKYKRQSITFQFEEDVFSKDAQGVINFYHEVIILMNFIQTKPQVKRMNINYYDLYYTVMKNRDEKEIVIGKDEINENDFIKYEEFFIPNHHVGFKPLETILR